MDIQGLVEKYEDCFGDIGKLSSYTSYNSNHGCQTSSKSPKEHSIWHETKKKKDKKKWQKWVTTDWVNSLVIVEK